MSGLSRFAAAFGFKATASAEKNQDDDDNDKKAARAKARERKADESDEDYAKRCAAEDEKDKAEDEKEKTDAAAAAAAAAAPSADTLAAARIEGVTAERKRWETTLSDPRAADRGIAACHMLAGTDMAAAIILTTLATLPAQAAQESEADGLQRRMAAERAANPAPSPGAGGGQDGDNSPTAVAARINAAADKARGKTK